MSSPITILSTPSQIPVALSSVSTPQYGGNNIFNPLSLDKKRPGIPWTGPDPSLHFNEHAVSNPSGSWSSGFSSSQLPTRAEKCSAPLPLSHNPLPLKKAPISASAPSPRSNLNFVFPPTSNSGGSPPTSSRPTIRITNKDDENFDMQTRGGSEVATDEIDQNHPSNHYIEHLKTVIPGSSEVPDTGVCSASTGLLPVAKNPLSTCAGKTVKAKIDHPTAALYSENVLPAEVPSPPIIPSADETLQYHLTKVDRQKQPGPTKRITHQRTDSTVSLASISSVSSIHGSNLPQWEQFDVLPREQESYTSFPKYQSNSMRSSSFMRIGAKIIGEDSKSGLSGIRGFLSRVWSKKDRNNDSVYRPSTLQRSSSAEEDEDHDDDDDRTVDSNSIISATRHSHAKVKTKAGPLLDLDARSGCSANHLESDTAKASFNIASQKLVFQDDKKGIIKDDEVHIVTGRKNSR